MIKLGIIGTPVSHSLSPRIHQFLGRALGIPLTYTAIETPLSSLSERLSELGAQGYRGLNVTSPLKIKAAELLSQHGLEIPDSGSVNTIRYEGRRLEGGINTDVAGFRYLLGAETPKSIAVLGAGGVLPSVLSVLHPGAFDRVVVYNRSQPKSEAARAQIAESPNWIHRELSQFSKESSRYDLVIHCLPPSVLGRLLGHRRHLFKPDTVFLDLNYGTRAEPVRTAVTCHGITYVDGLPMLAKQAVESFEYWTGYAVSTTLLEQLLLEIAEIQPG